MIQVRDLRVDYDDVCAVQDLTLEVPPGEIFGLIGPNGAGKTTTLRAMVGLIEPTYGEVLLNGVDVSTHRAQAVANVGFMPDFSPLYDDLTVYEFLDLFAASYHMPPAERKPAIEKHLAQVELTEKRDAMTNGLSRGMKQRLMLAKTLLPNPKIVLLDEPASGVDPHARILLKNILKQQRAEGKTVIISSHILSELSEFCTSIGVMERGRMVISGRVEDVASRVFSESRYAVEVIDGATACLATLTADERVSAVAQDGNGFRFAFAGDDRAASELLAALLTAGARVIQFGRNQETLEELFLQIGAKEVA